ncbi:MAG: serine/threonine protein kinase [Xanthomonadales bacterium]|nr:serine/threonine protein kinase [Xanthomonadales bacterium]
MNPADLSYWSKVERLLDAALDRPHGEREEFVRAHAADAVVAQGVLDLLARDARVGDFLEDAARCPRDVRASDGYVGEAAPPAAGQTIGAWRLLREIGSGGMAVVWLAERADGGPAQQAALKLIRNGLHGTLLRERFARERRILSLLRHPRVARLVDGGVADGQPFLVLDHVDGLPITDWCARHHASPTRRIALIRQVCEAVAFAHARLVIHRDLKPSNILVDAQGDVHLLDFGIAKILAGDHSETTALTAFGGRAMTAAYAAPEQVEGRPLGVAVDVYALGVVLYELLTGHLPYRVPRASVAALEEAVLHEEPRAASTAVDAAQAQQCGISLGRLRRELRGDLDRILATVLDKNPDRRYASAAAFADDLDRHVRGLPVRAQRTSLRYRTGKFLRRHAFGLAVAAALFVAILAGLAGTLWQANRAADAAREAHAEATAASAVRDLLLGMFNTSDPDIARGRDPSASELLDTAARRVQAGLADQPALKARLLGVIADLNRKLGNYALAADLFGQAAGLPAMAAAENTEERWRLRTGRAAALTLAGDFDAADAEFARIETDPDRSTQPSQLAPARARMQVELGELRRRQGRYAEARDALDAALAHYRGAPDDDGHLDALHRSADLELNRGHIEEAAQAFHDLLGQLRNRYGEDHTEIARAQHDYAAVLSQLGRLDAAEESMRNALEMRLRLLGEHHPAVAESHWSLAAMLRQQGHFDDAETHYRAALAIFRDSLGDDSAEVARVYNGLGALALARADYSGAETFLSQAYERYAKALGSKHPEVGITLNNIAGAQRRLGRLEEAEQSARRALAVLGAALPDGHHLIAVARFTLGSIVTMRGDFGEAVTLLEPAARALDAALGTAHPDVARAKLQWALALALNGDVAAARVLVDSVAIPGNDRRSESDSLYVRGRVRLLAGAHRDACPDLDRAWRMRDQLGAGAQDTATLEAELYLGACQLGSGDPSGSRHIVHAGRLLTDSPVAAPIVRRDVPGLMRLAASRRS